MHIDRDLLRQHHELFVLLAEGIGAIGRRIDERTALIMTTLKDIQDDLATLSGEVDQLTAARSAQEASDLDDIKTRVGDIREKIKTALTPVDAAPVVASDTEHPSV